MTSKTIICAIAAASFSFASLSYADDDDRRGSRRDSSRSEQRGDRDRHGHDSDRRDVNRRDHLNHPGHRGYDRHGVRSDRNYGARGPYFYRGGRIPREYRTRQYVVNNWHGHRLSAPPRGQQWVQVGSDYVLIAIATGVIAQLVLSR